MQPKPLFVKMEKSAVDDFKKRFSATGQSTVSEEVLKMKPGGERSKKEVGGNEND